MKFPEVIHVFHAVTMKFLLLSTAHAGTIKRLAREADSQPDANPVLLNSPFTNHLLSHGPFVGPPPPIHNPLIHDPLIHDPLIHDPIIHSPFIHDQFLFDHITQGQFPHIIHAQPHPQVPPPIPIPVLDDAAVAALPPNAAAIAAAAAGITTVKPPTSLGLTPPGACSTICSILDLLIFNPNFSTLISAVKAAGLVETLSLPGPITIFAPTNEAFEKLDATTLSDLLSDREKLRALLLRHVSNGRIKTVDLPSGTSTLVTGAGEEVTLASLPLGVSIISSQGTSKVIDADVNAANGIIHVVDAVF